MESGIIIMSYSKDWITREKTREYDLMLHPFRSGRSLSQAEAKKYIKENGLVMVVNNEDGAIWDTPDKDFQRRWKGCLSHMTSSQSSKFFKFWR